MKILLGFLIVLGCFIVLLVIMVIFYAMTLLAIEIKDEIEELIDKE